MTSDDSARLLERLLEDPAFRARFRRNPAVAARDSGFEALAQELEQVERPFQTLEIRESRSSAAGVMLAAAVEGLGLFELSKHVLDLGPEDALAADSPDTDSDAESDDSGASDSYGDPGESDDSDEESDEEEPDEEEPDEEEPDEEEPDEVGPDADDLSDDENGGDESEDGGDDADDSDDGSDSGDSGDSGDPEDSGDSGESDDSDEDIEIGHAPDAYPGDDAEQEEVGAWMANEAQKRKLPPELPVMAALVESGMQNLPGGDADSAGFFQMRLSIWDSGDYAGYRASPEKQLDWFFDHAEEVKAQRVARGLPTDPDHYGEWIADVERPAAQYRGRYQLQLDDARRLLRRAFPDGDGLEDIAQGGGGPEPRAGSKAREAVAEARLHLGTPYQWGGESPTTGFDCSGLVQWAYAKAGIQIPRVTDQQIAAPGGIKVGRKHLLPGDLVFFRDASGYVHHVGMSLGGDRFIEAPRTGLNVRISSLKDPYYAQQFTGARRFDPPAPRQSDARVMPALKLPEDDD